MIVDLGAKHEKRQNRSQNPIDKLLRHFKCEWTNNLTLPPNLLDWVAIQLRHFDLLSYPLNVYAFLFHHCQCSARTLFFASFILIRYFLESDLDRELSGKKLSCC